MLFGCSRRSSNTILKRVHLSAPVPTPTSDIERITLSIILRNAAVGLAVSFVALSLGAAFGLLSGRGAFAGMISAGVISIIASPLDGTRVQCSGPTAPMSVVTATVRRSGLRRVAEPIARLRARSFHQYCHPAVLCAGRADGAVALGAFYCPGAQCSCFGLYERHCHVGMGQPNQEALWFRQRAGLCWATSSQSDYRADDVGADPCAVTGAALVSGYAVDLVSRR